MTNTTRFIYKTTLVQETGTFFSNIPPEDILSFQCQEGQLVIWHYNQRNFEATFEYCLAFTGDVVDTEIWKYIGTCQDSIGLVWHLFSDITKKQS